MTRAVRLGLLGLGLVVLIGLALGWALRPRGANSPLYPLLPSPTIQPALVSGDPQPISFTELNNAPADHRNRRIQVSGAYTPVTPPSCRPYSGPRIGWSLVSEGLQLNAVGYESVLNLLAAGTEMTVTGVWRAYQGPLGCGKGPAVGTVWYLQVDKILQPNPLFATAQPMLTVVADEAGPLGFATPLPTTIIDTMPTEEPTPELPSDFPPEEPPIVAMTATPEPTQLPTTPLAPLPPTPDSFSTVDPNATPTPFLTQETPTIDPNATPGLETPTPVFPTNTPDGSGYPPPTATVSGYP